jgi:lysozyme family protein
MNSDWEVAIEFVLRMEGGETVENNPNDPGGETKFGISKKAYPNLDIANLTREDAKEIYKKDYWETCRCDELPTPLAIAVFDTAVNQGTGKARRLLQTSLGVIADGVIGEQTITAAHKAGTDQVRKFLAERLVEYARTMAKNQALLYWGFTWSYRVISLAELILQKAKA